ncbi:CBR-TAT-4.2 protein [Ditylenchus destructor]|uniref:CBR-TAT-4.2 protein n=1 Tax=Ditylenchus destructor TaxID=166010 RepID=A0AAD4R9U0_9BILA|nr:CBR-TAT-4.2 protein [Ditylenchus destructor]
MNSYKSASDIYSEVCDILPRGAARLIGIYYDCSSKIPHFQQAAIGCICEIDEIKIFETNFALQLTRRGFEKMTLPKISKAVYSSQKATGILSGVRLNNAREKVKSVVQGHDVHSPCLIEVHCIKKDIEYVDIFAPLDHLDELTVGEYIKESELEEHLAKQKFDSDEGNSHSETDTESSSQIVEENDVDMSA